MGNSRVRVRIVPGDDTRFASIVRSALAKAEGRPVDGTDVDSERALRNALGAIRLHYPDVWIRQQDALGSLDNVATFYVFRDNGTDARRKPGW